MRFQRTLALLAALAPAVLAQSPCLIVSDQAGVKTALSSGGLVVLAADRVGGQVSSTLTFTYLGSHKAVIQGADLYGAAGFAIAEPPALPVTLDAGGSVTVSLNYSASSADAASGSFLLTYKEATTQNGSTVYGPASIIEINLGGTAPDLLVAYALPADQNARSLSPGATLDFGDIRAAAPTIAAVSVINRGSGKGRVVSVSLTGADFRLLSTPVLPADIPAGSKLDFNLQCSPSQNGVTTGALTLDFGTGTTVFPVQANAAGPVYSYQLVDGTSKSAITPGVPFDLSGAVVGEVRTLTIVVQNTGTAAGTINSVSLMGADFGISDGPLLPATLAPGASLSIVLRFAPTTAGSSVGRLRIDSNAFELDTAVVNGISFAYTVEGQAAPVRPNNAIPAQALQQPAIGLTLDQPTPFALRGALTISQDAGSYDSSVQFATGGQTVIFDVPANTSQAVFPNNLDRVRLQTGTVAGNIVLTTAFVNSQGVDLTPATPQRLTLTVPPSAPTLLHGEVSATSSSSFTVEITGFTTTCELAKLDLQFTPVPGYRFPSNQFSVDINGPATVWFRTGTGGYGGLFSVSIPFSATGKFGGTNPQLLDLLQTISTSVSNAQGSSSALSIGVH